jgi:hypothetical protein
MTNFSEFNYRMICNAYEDGRLDRQKDEFHQKDRSLLFFGRVIKFNSVGSKIIQFISNHFHVTWTDKYLIEKTRAVLHDFTAKINQEDRGCFFTDELIDITKKHLLPLIPVISKDQLAVGNLFISEMLLPSNHGKKVAKLYLELFQNNEVTDIQAFLRALSLIGDNVTQLDIQSKEMKDDDLEKMREYCPNLRFLKLSCPNITPIELFNFTRSHSKIEYVDIDFNSLKEKKVVGHFKDVLSCLCENPRKYGPLIDNLWIDYSWKITQNREELLLPEGFIKRWTQLRSFFI